MLIYKLLSIYTNIEPTNYDKFIKINIPNILNLKINTKR